MKYSILILLYIFLQISKCAISQLSINANDTTINSQSTHTFIITYTNSASRSSFAIYFPTCVTMTSGVTSVTLAGNTISVTQTGANHVKFSLSPTITGTSYTFNVNNVKNCFKTGTFKTFFIFNNADNANQTWAPYIGLYYKPGAISSCQISFNGSTYDLPSTMNMSFVTQNPVVGSTFGVRLQYPTYFSSNQYLTFYNSPISTPYYIATCGLSINGVNTLSVNAAISFNNNTLLCPFTLGSTVINPGDSLTLHINNILNPVTSTMYASNTDFTITTYDNTASTYDISSICSVPAVPIAKFPATFSQTAKINTNMYPVSISSSSFIPIRLMRNDQVTVSFTAGSFVSCAGNIVIDKTSGSSPTIFIQQVSSISNTLLFQSNGTSTSNNTLTINFQNCQFEMPKSTIPITFIFTFAGTTSTPTIYDQYMQMTAILVPDYVVMQSTQVQLSLTAMTIGDISSYIFTIRTSQQLSQSPRIVIDFPVQISISSAAATLTSCNIAINTVSIGSKSCGYLAPNSIQINITHSTTPTIPASTIITVTFNNIQNPSNPLSLNTFDIRTYYTQGNAIGLVQVGTNVVSTPVYNARVLSATIPSNNFTVYTAGTQFQVVYTVGVDLPPGSITILTFSTGILQNLAYITTTISTASLTTSTSNVFTFSLSSSSTIAKNTVIAFTFTCLTPAQTGIYNTLTMKTQYNSTPYQQTSIPITMQILLPYTNSFIIGPTVATAITGLNTVYILKFTTIVPHPNQYILQLTFPAGTNMVNGLSQCTFGCAVSSFVNDTSFGTTDRIQMMVNGISTAASYQVRISNIINQRQVAMTGAFTIRTMTSGTRQSILTGQSYTQIITANTLTSSFYNADDYYRNNINPIHFTINITNKLQANDYFIIKFKIDSYTRYNNGVIACSQGICTYTEPPVSTQLDIKIVLTAAMAIDYSIDVELTGLISSSTSSYGLQYLVSVDSYSAAGNPIDRGSMMYRVDCGDNPTIISKNCKTCSIVSSIYSCTSCYNPPDSLYNNSYCTNNCGNISLYQTYPNSGVCAPCQPPCYSCNNLTSCRTCISGFFLLVGADQCIASCNTSNGYYSYNQLGFSYCSLCTIANCMQCTSTTCTACKSGMALLSNQCLGGCSQHMYNSGGVCLVCDVACDACDGPNNNNCFNCSIGYNSINGACTDLCPIGQVILANGSCGCDPVCTTCVNYSNKCLSCPIGKYFYNNQCFSACPTSTYILGQSCIDCTSGCMTCSSTTCIQCLNNYNIFENKCYQDCKVLGQRYVSMMDSNGILRCDQCPSGCTDCNSQYLCTSCESGYFLNGTVCKRQCQFTNTCDDVPVSEPILPIFGLITLVIWVIICVVFKLFFVKNMYLPYAIFFGGTLIQFVILAATLGSLDIKIKSLISAGRLLAALSVTSPLYLSLGILAVALFLNYIMNIVSIWIFCKFIRPMILPRQIDIITNYAALVFGVLTTYRFYMIAFCRMFKKPFVQVSGPEKFRNLHIILGVSAFLDIIPLVGAFLLVLNSLPLTILYMLGIDLIILIILMEIVYIWVVLRPKQKQYYLQTKKYSLQENHITQEGSIHNNEKDVSKIKLTGKDGTNQKIQVQQINGEQNVDDLPTMQPNVVKIVPKSIQKINYDAQSEYNAKTKRKDKSFFNEKTNNQSIIQGKNQNSDRNNIRPPINSGKVKKHERNQSQAQIQHMGRKNKDEKFQFQVENNESQYNDADPTIIQKSIKVKTGTRSSNIKLTKAEQSLDGMKKKRGYGTFESQIADSNVDEVDFDSIIQTRVIDRSNSKKPRDTMTQADKNEKQHQQISPSWFNIQNQRYDIDDKQLE